jgi:hypothetical protein
MGSVGELLSLRFMYGYSLDYSHRPLAVICEFTQHRKRRTQEKMCRGFFVKGLFVLLCSILNRKFPESGFLIPASCVVALASSTAKEPDTNAMRAELPIDRLIALLKHAVLVHI